MHQDFFWGYDFFSGQFFSLGFLLRDGARGVLYGFVVRQLCKLGVAEGAGYSHILAYFVHFVHPPFSHTINSFTYIARGGLGATYPPQLLHQVMMFFFGFQTTYTEIKQIRTKI